MKNLAFIDAQNLRRGTTDNRWMINHQRFRTYLRDKYHVETAYYYLGYYLAEHRALYEKVRAAGFVPVFKETNKAQKSRKKGNVDCDIVLDVMAKLRDEGDSFDKIVLVSGDGDFYRLVKYLIDDGRLEKILFPNRQPSSLYKKLDLTCYDYLDRFKAAIAEQERREQ